MARTIDEKIVIKNYALGYPYYYKGVYHYNLDLFRTWWKNLSYLNKAYPPVIIAVAGALVGTLFSWSTELLKTGKATFNRPVNVISAGLVAGLLFWFYNAPDLRFGNGIILPFIALTVAGLADRFKPGKLITVAAGGTFVVICLSSVLSVSGLALSQTTLQTNNVEISLMMQPPYPQPDTATVMVDGQHTWRSETRCWECPLPCSYTVDSFRYIQPGNIEAGFTPKNEQNATGTQ
jgi:hypothetical protein